jgi:hypothetical protein
VTISTNGTTDATECPRCAWLTSRSDDELGALVFLPHRVSGLTRNEEGQRLRSLAIAKHAAAGHEDLDRDRAHFTQALREKK